MNRLWLYSAIVLNPLLIQSEDQVYGVHKAWVFLMLRSQAYPCVIHGLRLFFVENGAL